MAKGITKNNKPEGTWEFYYSDGALKARGDFENGEKIGHWIYFYKNGKTESKGAYKQGKKTGIWKEQDALFKYVNSKRYIYKKSKWVEIKIIKKN